MRQRIALLVGLALVAQARAGSGSSSGEGDKVAGAAVASPQAYQDRLIPGNLSREIFQDGPVASDAAGAPRTFSLDLRYQANQSSWGDSSSGDHGVAAVFGGSAQIANWGTWTLDASLASGSRSPFGAATSGTTNGGANRSTFSIYQKRMPLGGGRYLSSAVGDVLSPVSSLDQEGSSFFLPARTMRGWKVELNEPAGSGEMTVNASMGHPGTLDAVTGNGFRADGSSLLLAGMEYRGRHDGSDGLGPDRNAPGLAYAATISAFDPASVNAASPYPGSATSSPAGGQARSEALLQSIRYAADGLFARASAVSFSREPDLAPGSGVWADLGADSAHISQRLGLHRISAGFSWAGLTMPNDTTGGYYTWRMIRPRNSFNFGASYAESLGGADKSLVVSSRTSQIYAGFQTNLASASSAGLSVSALRSQALQSAATYSRLEAFYAARTDAADLRVQLTHTDRNGSDGGSSVQFDQGWRALGDLSVKTFISAGVSPHGGRSISAGGSLSYYLGPSSYLNLSGTLQHAANADPAQLYGSAYGSGQSGSWGMSRDLSMSAQFALTGIARGLSLVAAISGNTASSTVLAQPGAALPFIGSDLGPAGGASSLDTVNHSRSVWVGLRYAFAAGSPSAPIGGSPGSGGGSISGMVFLDANGNGTMDASEQPASAVEVVLDGRYVTHTDSQGRFGFPFVAEGTHKVEALTESLPLPWRFNADVKASTADVRVRSRTFIEIGATRGGGP